MCVAVSVGSAFGGGGSLTHSLSHECGREIACLSACSPASLAASLPAALSFGLSANGGCSIVWAPTSLSPPPSPSLLHLRLSRRPPGGGAGNCGGGGRGGGARKGTELPYSEEQSMSEIASREGGSEGGV